MSALVFDGHPNPNSLTSALAARYAKSHPNAQLVAVRDLGLDLIHDPNISAEELPGAVREGQRMVTAADHLVIVAPTWWAGLPAVTKNMIDQVFRAGWAYRYRPLPGRLRGGLPQGLLGGRSARVILTSDTPVALLPLSGDHAARVLAREVLPFCGIKPVRVTKFGGVRWSTARDRERWLAKVARLARRDAGIQHPRRR